MPNQARSIFTAICMVWNIDADTAECDNMLNELRACAVTNEGESVYEMTDEGFDNFMLAWIV